MPKLLIVIASTRPGRVGLPVGTWAAEAARKHGGFDVEVADLAEINLPMLDEPGPPRMGKYQHEHTKRWSETVASADALLFVTPEYNHAPPPSLLNAISFLFWEFSYKAAGFVSYGGPSCGLRSVQVLKQALNSLRVMFVAEGVAIPFPIAHVKDGVFSPPPNVEAFLPYHLDELMRWTKALEGLRSEVPERRKELPPGAPPPPPGAAPGPPPAGR